MLEILKAEMARSMEQLKRTADPSYFLSYEASETESAGATGSFAVLAFHFAFALHGLWTDRILLEADESHRKIEDHPLKRKRIWMAWLMMAGATTLASGQPLQVILALDISPGTEQAIGLIRSRLFQAGDRVGVVAFGTRGARILQTATNNHDAIDAALQKAGIRVGASIGPVQLNIPLTTDLVAGIEQSCQELTRSTSAESKRAIIVLFGSDDPNLQTQIENVKAALSGARAQLYVIVIDRSTIARQTPVSPQVWTPRFPSLTAQLLGEIAEASGGKVYRRNWDVKPILAELRKQ
jgi:hypothetical protein